SVSYECRYSAPTTLTPELIRVRCAAAAEGVAEVVRLLALQVPAPQQIVGNPRQSADAPVPRPERGLDRGQREGAALRDFERHLAGRLFQLVVRHDLVDQPDLERLARRHSRVAKPDFLRLLLADQVFEVPGAVAGIEAAHHR